MKKLLFASLLLGSWLGSTSGLRAQGTPALPSPATVPQSTIVRPPSPTQTVTLDVEASTRKTAKPKPSGKPKEGKSEKKAARPKASNGPATTRGLLFAANRWPGC